MFDAGLERWMLPLSPAACLSSDKGLLVPSKVELNQGAERQATNEYNLVLNQDVERQAFHAILLVSTLQPSTPSCTRERVVKSNQSGWR